MASLNNVALERPKRKAATDCLPVLFLYILLSSSLKKKSISFLSFLNFILCIPFFNNIIYSRTNILVFMLLYFDNDKCTSPKFIQNSPVTVSLIFYVDAIEQRLASDFTISVFLLINHPR